MASSIRCAAVCLIISLYMLSGNPVGAQHKNSTIAELLKEAEQELYKTTWKSLSPAVRALELAQQTNDEHAIADAQLLLGRAYLVLGDMEKALQFLLPALQTFQKMGMAKEEAQTRRRLGSLYLGLGDRDRALDELNRALTIFRGLNDQQGVSETLISIGVLHWRSNELEPALVKYKEALSIYIEINNPIGIAIAHINIGEVRHSMGNDDTALDHYSQALALTRKTGYKQGTASVLHSRAKLYTDNKQLDKAWADIREVETIASAGGLLGLVQKSLDLMAEIKELQGSTEEARQYRARAAETAAKLAEKQAADQIAKIRAQQELDRQRDRIEAPRENRITASRIRNVIIILLSLLAVLSLITAMILRRRRKKQEEQESQKHNLDI